MKEKEKAKELFDSYWYCLLQSNIENRNYWSQQCALIAVDVILNKAICKYSEAEYWQEVKKEIEKL